MKKFKVYFNWEEKSTGYAIINVFAENLEEAKKKVMENGDDWDEDRKSLENDWTITSIEAIDGSI